VKDKKRRGIFQQTWLLRVIPHTPQQVAVDAGGRSSTAWQQGDFNPVHAHGLGVSYRVAEVAYVRVFVHADAQPGHTKNGP